MDNYKDLCVDQHFISIMNDIVTVFRDVAHPLTHCTFSHKRYTTRVEQWNAELCLVIDLNNKGKQDQDPVLEAVGQDFKEAYDLWENKENTVDDYCPVCVHEKVWENTSFYMNDIREGAIELQKSLLPLKWAKRRQDWIKQNNTRSTKRHLEQADESDENVHKKKYGTRM